MLPKLILLASLLILLTAPVVEASSWSGPIRLTWYGGHYFGNRTACGKKYTRHIVGVATWLPLKCGTKIELRWKHHRVIAPVIDRMPRHPWAKFDASAQIACNILNGPRLQNVCFTRDNVYWRIVR